MFFAVLNIFVLLIFLFVLYHHRKKPLSFRILISLLFGLGYSIFLKWTGSLSHFFFIKDTLHFIGQSYLALLKMLVIPLITTSIIHTLLNLGTNSIEDIKKISFYASGMLLALTSLASLIGLMVGKLLNVGAGLTLPDTTYVPKHADTGIVDTLLGMIPANPIAIMSHENTIAVVLFAILIGVAARLVQGQDEQKLQTFRLFIADAFTIVKKLTALVLELTPYGIFALMSLLLLDKGMPLFVGMLTFMIAMYIAMLLMLVLHSIILLCCGYSPIDYFKNAYTALLVAFTTRSSFGTLPVTEETLNKKFGINQAIATFTPSIGATIGMNACAGIFPAMLVVMTLTILHQPLTWEMVLLVMFINAIASLGISGIPGTAYIAATVTLTSLNLPYAIIALVQGIDPIIDMGRTATNVNGTMTTALAVNRFVPLKPAKTSDELGLGENKLQAD